MGKKDRQPASEEEVSREETSERQERRERKDKKRRDKKRREEAETSVEDTGRAWADFSEDEAPAPEVETSSQPESRPRGGRGAGKPALDPNTPIGEVSLWDGIRYYRAQARDSGNPIVSDTLGELIKVCLNQHGRVSLSSLSGQTPVAPKSKGRQGRGGRQRGGTQGGRDERPPANPGRPYLPTSKGKGLYE